MASHHFERLSLTIEQATKVVVKKRIAEIEFAVLCERPLQGQYWRRLESSGLDRQLSTAWLGSPTLRREAEGFIIAVQEQMVATRNFLCNVSHVLPSSADLCWFCGVRGESIDHLLGCCSALAPSLYISRHDNVVRILHWAICYDHRVPDILSSPARHSLSHLVVFPDGGRLLWETSIPTDRRFPANRPNLVIREGNRVYLIDVSIPLDINVSMKKSEERVKYDPLRSEVKRLWEVDLVEVIPIVIGSLGGISPDLPNLLRGICGRVSVLRLLQQ